jgi:hypothetical protein
MLLISNIFLIRSNELTYTKYAKLVIKWNDFIIAANKDTDPNNNIFLTKHEAKTLLKKIHPDITKSSNDSDLVQKLIKIVK